MGLGEAEWEAERVCNLCIFHAFLHDRVFGDLSDPVVPIRRGGIEDVLTAFPYPPPPLNATHQEGWD